MASKDTKKTLKQQYLKKEREEFIKMMPLSATQLNELLWKIDETLQAADGQCQHDYQATLLALKASDDKEKILSWLASYGGKCDCEVLMYVPQACYFVLENLENSYLSDYIPEDEDDIEDNNLPHTSFNPIADYLKRISYKKEAEIALDSGLRLQLPKPWYICSHPLRQPKQYEIRYGKNKIDGGKICVHVLQIPLPFKDEDKNFVKAWQDINEYAYKSEKIRVSDDFLITRDTVLIGSHPVCEVMVQNSSHSRLTLSWIFDPKNPTWYLLLDLRYSSFANDRKIFLKFLEEAQYQYNA